MAMTPRPDQIKTAEEAKKVLDRYNLVYIAGEERSGKTLSSVLICEESKDINKILVVTVKKAIEGWSNTFDEFKTNSRFTIINYESIHKIKIKDFDCIILDEAHSKVSSYPKKSFTWKNTRKYTKNKKIIYLSATPYAQGPQLLYNQFSLSDYSPWIHFSTYYSWYKKYAKLTKKGEYKTIHIGHNLTKTDYASIRPEDILDSVQHLLVIKLRKDSGITQEPKDVLHFIELSKRVKEIYNTILIDKVIRLRHKGKKYTLVCDSQIKLRWSLHMLEGGTLKIDGEYLDLGNSEKVDYILTKWGDTKDMVIMHQYKADKIKLETNFKNAKILQATSSALGVDLSMYNDLIIYSQDFSTSRHSQRRARQAHPDRTKPINVHFLLIKNAVSHQIYKTVSINKKNFVDSVFEKTKL